MTTKSKGPDDCYVNQWIFRFNNEKELNEFLANVTIAPLVKKRGEPKTEDDFVTVDIDTVDRIWKSRLEKLFLPLGTVTFVPRKPRGTSA